MKELTSHYFLFSFIAFSAGLLILKSIYWTYIWQLKEYRVDRMLDFLTTKTGKKALTNIWTISELALTIVLLFSINTGSIFTPAAYLFFLYVVLRLLLFLRWRVFPVWTIKGVFISVVTSSFAWLAMYLLSLVIPIVVSAAVIISLIPFIVSACVLLLTPLTQYKKHQIIKQAKQKLEEINPIVIGITGSYGKTSTKEFLKTILETQFTVLATPKHVNVDIGVAQTIMQSLEPKHDIFIVEMGAYRQGEIEAICNIVSPIIGVITAVKNLHISLFGDLETIKLTKAELIQSLPSSGVAILNRDSQECLEIGEMTRAQKKFFSTTDISHVYASDIHAERNEVQFTLHIGKNATSVTAKLHGQQVIPAIVAAATVADHLGVSIETIAERIMALEPIDGTMHLKYGFNHASIIDDSYNANPDGFIAAMDYLDIFTEKRKIIITPGMQELGSESDKEHRNVGTRAGSVADMLIITKKDFAQPLKEAAKAGGMQENQIIISERPAHLRKLLDSVTNDDVILIEGRIHPSLKQFLLEA